MSSKNNQKERRNTNSSRPWTDYNTKESKFSVSGLLKAQKFLLIGIEKLIESHLELLPKAAHILKKLYDENICTEEAILAWGAKRSKLVDKELAKQIRAKCQPVLSWLEEAEEESETDEEDEDVEFNDRARQLGTVIEKLSKDETENFQITTIVDNGEEIDIDNI